MTIRKRIGGLIAVAVLLVVPVILYWQRWNLYDYARLRGYQASSAIQKLATDTSMNDKTRKLFYVYHPDLEDKDSFNANCKTSEKTIVLGCYVSGQGIYLYNVTDDRLAGVVEVTAAHETLHAAYGRLNASEKTRVTTMLNEAYAKVTDPRIRTTIDDYRNNGADVTNELHSILGTEIRSLTPELEQYYARYFTDRSKIVSQSERYEQAFTERKQRVEDFDNQLGDLNKQIDAGQASLAKAEGELGVQRHNIDQLLAAKQYEAYNQQVPVFNAAVNSYNAEVRSVRSLIERYNTIVAQRNAVAAEEGDLVKALDSRPNTLQTQ